MSIIRTLAGPALGTAAAGIVLYSVGSSLALRTHQVTDTLHSSSRNLRRLAEVDDTQDVLKALHIAPETVVLAGTLDEKRGKVVNEALPSAYQRPGDISLTEQVKARWNQHLIALTHAVADTDVDKIISTLASVSSTVYEKVTGQVAPAVADKLSSNSPNFASSLRALSPNAAQAAATLREPLPPRIDPRLHAPDTNYVGQGTSLR